MPSLADMGGDVFRFTDQGTGHFRIWDVGLRTFPKRRDGNLNSPCCDGAGLQQLTLRAPGAMESDLSRGGEVPYQG